MKVFLTLLAFLAPSLLFGQSPDQLRAEADARAAVAISLSAPVKAEVVVPVAPAMPNMPARVKVETVCQCQQLGEPSCLCLPKGLACHCTPTHGHVFTSYREVPAAPTVKHMCQCHKTPDEICTCDAGACECDYGQPCKHAKTAVAPELKLVVVCTSPCEPCERLKAGLRNESVGIEGTMYTDSATARQYGVTQFPTIILLKDGKEIARRTGEAPVADLSAWIQAVKDRPAKVGLAPARMVPVQSAPVYRT